MGRIAKKLTDLIGNTPLLELENFSREHEAGATIIAKLEYFNPGGSQENGGDERDVNNYFKKRVRAYNEICGRPARGMADASIPVLFPIPQIFIDSNTGRTITQNPGY